MTPVQNLHYAIGQLAYAMACADGKVQETERKKFHALVAAEIRIGDPDFDISDIIFRILDKDHAPLEDAYRHALHEIRTNSLYLSPELKATFIQILKKVAKAWPQPSGRETELLQRFRRDLETIKGDPDIYVHRH